MKLACNWHTWTRVLFNFILFSTFSSSQSDCLLSTCFTFVFRPATKYFRLFFFLILEIELLCMSVDETRHSIKWNCNVLHCVLICSFKLIWTFNLHIVRIQLFFSHFPLISPFGVCTQLCGIRIHSFVFRISFWFSCFIPLQIPCIATNFQCTAGISVDLYTNWISQNDGTDYTIGISSLHSTRSCVNEILTSCSRKPLTDRQTYIHCVAVLNFKLILSRLVRFVLFRFFVSHIMSSSEYLQYNIYAALWMKFWKKNGSRL